MPQKLAHRHARAAGVTGHVQSARCPAHRDSAGRPDMRVHHLNCGTMHPRFVPDGLVCHVLLLETAAGLVLVDSGLRLGR